MRRQAGACCWQRLLYAGSPSLGHLVEGAFLRGLTPTVLTRQALGPPPPQHCPSCVRTGKRCVASWLSQHELRKGSLRELPRDKRNKQAEKTRPPGVGCGCGCCCCKVANAGRPRSLLNLGQGQRSKPEKGGEGTREAGGGLEGNRWERWLQGAAAAFGKGKGSSALKEEDRRTALSPFPTSI